MAIARWQTFFKDAGIPSGPASDYAVIFSDNRMRMDMLNELSKEILVDLGINVMGDVIAILRHSKKVYAEISRSAAEEFDVNRTKANDEKKKNRLFADLKPKPVVESRDFDKKSTPALNPIAKQTQEKKRKTVNTTTALVSKENPSTKSLSARFAEYNPAPAKKRKEAGEVITISVPIDEPPKGRKIPVKEKRAIPKESTLPSKKTVFDRLGSASSEASSKEGKSQKTSTTLQMDVQKDQKTSNVFSRLGKSSTLSSLTTKEGLSSKFANLTSSKPSVQQVSLKSEPVLTVTLRKGDSTRIGLQDSHSVLRPVKHVKPIPRKCLAMDLEGKNQLRQSKQSKTGLDNGVRLQPIKKPEMKTASKSSVFERLGR